MAAKGVNVEAIGSDCESLSDPRHTRNRKPLLVAIVVIAVCGLVCGCDGPTAIPRGAAKRRRGLGQFRTRPNGIPSRDCIRRRLRALKPDAFPKGFEDWVAHALRTDDRGPDRRVAIDGKTGRGSHDAAPGLGPLHRVRAWAREEGIALGPVATEEKSHAITAIPRLLELIELTDTVVPIDALGCQKEIAHTIVDGGGDVGIRVKDNQPTLRETIEADCAKHLERDRADLRYRSYETGEATPGRIDERSYFLTKVPPDFALKKVWPWIQALGYALRVTQHGDGREPDETRDSILSRYLSGQRFREAGRGHWGLESMHWVLDLTFREDESRTRERTLGRNLSWRRRFAVTLLKRHPINDSLRGKMIRGLMNTEFLTEVLTLQQH